MRGEREREIQIQLILIKLDFRHTAASAAWNFGFNGGEFHLFSWPLTLPELFTSVPSFSATSKPDTMKKGIFSCLSVLRTKNSRDGGIQASLL